MERGNIFWPLCESLKLCGWHSSLCSDRADFNRVWSIKSGAQSTPQSPQCCLCLSSSTSLGSVSPLRVVLVEAAGAGQGENAQSSLFSCVRMKTHCRHLVPLFFRKWSCSFPLSCDHKDPRYRDNQMERRELMCPYWHPSEMLIVLIPFLEWPEQSQDDTFRFLDYFFFPRIAITEFTLQSKDGI